MELVNGVTFVEYVRGGGPTALPDRLTSALAQLAAGVTSCIGAGIALRTPGSKSSVFLQAAGQIDLFNKGGTAAFSVTARTAGNGRLTLGDAAGNTVVEAGSTTDGIGIVRVGPRLGAPSGGLMIPSSIVGKK